MIRPLCPGTIVPDGLATVQGQEAWTRVILKLLLVLKVGVKVDVLIVSVVGAEAASPTKVNVAVGVLVPILTLP